jgi:hypothetical protein
MIFLFHFENEVFKRYARMAEVTQHWSIEPVVGFVGWVKLGFFKTFLTFSVPLFISHSHKPIFSSCFSS